VSALRLWLRDVAWYFGIGSAPEAERRRLERDEEDERRPWWREAITLVGGVLVFETLHALVGFALALAIMFAAMVLLGLLVRGRSAERPPVD
jgi:fatty acid desaturase